MIMATKVKNLVPTNTVECDTTRRMSIAVCPSRHLDKQVVSRPAQRIGRLLALQQTDGVDGTVNNLFKGQYDDAFGDVDPATDSRTDFHLLETALMRRRYNETMSKTE